mgnify:CR=1 FL=1
MWIIPANAQGTWKSSRGALNVTEQKYQMLSGTFGEKNAVISDAKMNGYQIMFTAGGTQYAGHVNGNTIEGTYKGADGSGKWTATKQ